MNRLERIQNKAARLITHTRKSDHITPVLRDLHWLPVGSRITYKILLLVFKCLHDLAPSYLSKLVTIRNPDRRLRNADVPHLQNHIPKKKVREQDFGFAAAALWNSLPVVLRTTSESCSLGTFKKLLKTHLFRSCYV